jgi:NUDIX domain
MVGRLGSPRYRKIAELLRQAGRTINDKRVLRCSRNICIFVRTVLQHCVFTSALAARVGADASQNVLVVLRTNEPAKGVYFIPGGRIRKTETVENAFMRILKNETGGSTSFGAIA